MADIFISYARSNRSQAEALATTLETQGWSVWWDTRLKGGDLFDERIEEELDAARCVVVLWSKDSVKSRWVRTEANEGMNRKILIPVLVEPVRQPLAFRLIQAIDLSGEQNNFHLIVPDVQRILRGNGNPGTLDLQASLTNSIGMEFVLIKPGTFMMGSNGGNEDERPLHRVKITKPYYLGKYTVTQGQWETIMGSNPSYFSKGQDHPVDSVSWNDVQDFILKLSKRERVKYRLPTEAEWEYACRAGTSSEYFHGDDIARLDTYVVSGKDIGQGHERVGSKRPNAWGLYDMLGNVWEWVQDWYADDYYKDSPVADPSGPSSGESRVLRGGSFDDNDYYVRCAFRFSDSPYFRS